jgi:hypothetical protein
MKWVREHTAEITITTLAVAVGVGVFAYAHKDEGRIEESKQRGAAIVQALERHRAEEGDYPAVLDALVPRYLAAIDPPTWGLRRWRYRRYTAAEIARRAAADSSMLYFQLSVAANEGGYPVLYYDFAGRRWVLNN